MKSIDQVIREADELDNRRRHQIENQIATINRLLVGVTYDEELRLLHEQLATAQSRIDKLEGRL